MKIRLLTIMAGPAGTAQPGQVVEVSVAMGRELVAGRYAELVEPETATLEAPETAALRQGRPRGRRAEG